MDGDPAIPLERDPDPRFTLANERTLLAWNRTALALIGGGLTAGKLLDFNSELSALVVGVAPIVVGGVLAVLSYRRWKEAEAALRLGQALPANGPAPWLAGSLVAIALVAGIVLVVDALA